MKSIDDTAFLARRGLKMLESSAIPWLRASAEGAAYLTGEAPRALSRGFPAARCPAAAAAVGAQSRIAASEAALLACFAQLKIRAPAADCGCRLVAVDSFLLDRREAFSFAPSVSALLISSSRPSVHMVAEALPPEAGSDRILIRSAQTIVAEAILNGETATLAFFDDPETIYSGTRTFFGYRRGRMAERLRLRNADGDRLSVLLGVERRDVTRQ